jgi:signal transduction histidine kinase
LNSLKWRIAAGYSLLLAVVIAAIGVIFVVRLQAILYDQASQHVNQTMNEIARFAAPGTNPLMLDQGSGSLETIINSANIANWETPTTFIQVDAVNGSLLAKGPNLGGTQFPRNPAVDAKHPGPVYRPVTMQSGPFLVEDQYLQLNPKQAVIVHVGEPLDALFRTFAQISETIVFILIAALVAVICLSILLAAQVTEPVNRLASAMRATGSDLLDRPVPLKERRDEIGQLAASFNDLLARLGEAFARERQFISDASHELKTPLTSINANAQMLLRWGDRDERIRTESLETIVGESGALASMVSGMLVLAKADRGDEIPKEPLSLATVVGEAVRGSSQRASEKGLELRFDAGSGALVLGEPNLLRQLASNLIDNAIKFTETGSVNVRVGSDEGNAWVEVRDTGPGIPEDELPYVFERFYRADKARSRIVPGTGLGLAIVRSIARVHGGIVTAEPAPGGGALFTATFPLLEARLTESS